MTGRNHRLSEIAGRKLHPQSQMMGFGYDPTLSEGALKPPIFLTSTFVFPDAASGKRFFEGVTGVRPGGAEGLVYGRFNGPDQEILEDRLAIWEEAEDALAALRDQLAGLVEHCDFTEQARLDDGARGLLGVAGCDAAQEARVLLLDLAVGVAGEGAVGGDGHGLRVGGGCQWPRARPRTRFYYAMSEF